MKSLLAAGMLLLSFGCASHAPKSPTQAVAGYTTAPVHRKPAQAATLAQQAVDRKCQDSFVTLGHQCDANSGTDDAAFNACLAPLKSQLQVCCQREDGSPDCAAEAQSVPTLAQRKADDQCQDDYSQGVGACYSNVGNNSPVFARCQSEQKAKLISCCHYTGGSENCSSTAE